MPVIPLPPDRPLPAALGYLAWRSLQVAAAVSVIVVPFGYATTGEHNHVLMGAGSGVAVGVGLNLRMGDRGRSASILIGAALGVVMALLGGGQGFAFGPGVYVPPVLGLGVGLLDGLGTQRVRTYRDAGLESLVMGALLALGVAPALGPAGAATALLLMPTMALIAGFVSRDAAGRRYSRPPVWLLVGALGVYVALVAADRLFTEAPNPTAVVLSGIAVVQFGIPTLMFVFGRAAATWLEPRLRVYAQLAEYLRVMWIPIGGFAAGYLAIILVFAGFCGMLDRFAPDSFTGAPAAGIGDWVSFSFFSAPRPGLHRHRPGHRARADARRPPAHPVGRLGARRLRRGHVVHPAAARTHRAPRRGTAAVRVAAAVDPSSVRGVAFSRPSARAGVARASPGTLSGRCPGWAGTF